MLGEVVAEILGESARLGKYERFRVGSRLNGDDWRLAQRMYLLQFGRCQFVFRSLVEFHIVVEAFALFQKPYDTL